MNLLFFLTPKAVCSYLYDDYTIRQAIERMESIGYSALPILSRAGAPDHTIMEIPHRRDNAPVNGVTEMQELVRTAVDQNFVPVVDDKGDFIGIVTRRAILRHYMENYVPDKALSAQ